MQKYCSLLMASQLLMLKIKVYTVVPLFFLFFVSCKKNEKVVPPVATGTRLQLSLDSLYLYAKETYYWYDALPDYTTFNPRQYATPGADLSSLSTTLKAITALAINPQTKQSYEYRDGHSLPLYSFIAEGNVITGQRGVVDMEGVGNDLGFGLAIVNDTSVYISYVEQGSAAASAGISRAMKLTHVNGDPVQANTNALNNLLGSPILTLRLQKQDSTLSEITIVSQKYTASPVLASAVLNAAAKKVGYIALARFSNLSTAQADLDAAFAGLSDPNISNLIVDLRYNGGGYVETAEYVANLIAPASLNNAVMFSEYYNPLLQQGKAPILKTIPYLDENRQPVYINGRKATYADINYSVSGNTYRFSKKSGLSGIKSIVFIVSGQTASASELLINCFKPYADVKLVGSTTYGKPVGFFGIGIDVYTAYLSQFRIVNAEGQGDYYSGMSCDVTAPDDVMHDFGDPQESCIKQALQYISSSTFRLNSGTSSISVRMIKGNVFLGMIEQRLKLK